MLSFSWLMRTCLCLANGTEADHQVVVVGNCVAVNVQTSNQLVWWCGDDDDVIDNLAKAEEISKTSFIILCYVSCVFGLRAQMVLCVVMLC